MPLNGRLYRLYWSFERAIAPGVRFAQLDYEDDLQAVVQPGTRWLDLGCGHQLLYPWRGEQERQLLAKAACVVGVDPEADALLRHPSIDLRVAGDAGALPFRDESFDLVTANMVVEHLPDPSAQFREVRRILAPGGRFVFHTPNALGYPALLARAVPDWCRALAARALEGRGKADRFPTFYRANTPSSIAAIARQTGFVVDTIDLKRTTAMFWFALPVAAVELAWLRLLGLASLARLRPNLIATLRRS